MKNLQDSINHVRERIARAAARGGRREDDVLLVAVTKRVARDLIEEAADLGMRDFGENYIQEARGKIEGFGREARWHMIGHLQSNKLKYIPRYFDFVHSIDRGELLEGLDRYERPTKILFELNLSGEASKHGATEDGLKRMLENVKTLNHVVPIGLMTMAPYVDDPEEVRPIFSRLREILHRVNREFDLTMTELSMGMSSDFDVAIEEGATMVRVGTALFGERS